MIKQTIVLSLTLSLILAQATTTNTTTTNITCSASQFRYQENSTVPQRCVNCDIGSETCLGYQNFTSCSRGWYANPLNASFGNNTVQCSICQQPSQNVVSVQTCQDAVTPLTCANGHYLNHQGMCVPCVANSTAACPATCETFGFHTNNSQCISCTDSANACNSKCLGFGFSNFQTGANATTQRLSCSRCLPQQYQAYTAFNITSRCEACPAGGQNCLLRSFSTVCNSGFQQVGGLCVQCAASNTSSCDGCNHAGFFSPNATSCVACASTTAACNSTCLLNGFYNNGTTCVQCPATMNAQTCTLTTAAPQVLQATVCKPGFALRETICVACPDPAGNCTTALTPLTCAATYYALNNACVLITTCASTTAVCSSACLNLGYFSGTNACTACGTNALSCTSATQHTTCAPGFGVQSTNLCGACPAGASKCNGIVATECNQGFQLTQGTCVLCHAQGICSSTIRSISTASCVSGFRLSGLNCVACIDTNALTCDTADAATNRQSLTCKPSTVLKTVTTEKVCTTCIDTDALTCEATDAQGARKSLTCKAGFVLKTQGTENACVRCQDIQATACLVADASGNVQSSQCNPGFVVKANGLQNQCVACSDTNAATCESTDTANAKRTLTCKVGFSLNSAGNCVACVDTNAVTCNATQIAVSCKSGFALVGTTCTACGDTNAETCHSANRTQSLTCKTNFYLDDGLGQCKAYTNNVATVTKVFTVASCLSGFFVDSNNGCVACLANSNAATCTDATAAGIQTCRQGFFRSTANPPTCIACLANSNAATCANATLEGVQSCLPGFYQIGNTCQSCTTKITNSATCSFVETQTTCANFKYVQNNQCVNCLSTTTNCSSVCLASGFYTTGNSTNQSCSLCIGGAATCNSLTHALTCLPGFYLNLQNTCSQCQFPNTAQCSNLTLQISSCLPGFQLINNNCVQCPANFQSCQQTATGLVGITCLSGFYLSNNACVKCPVEAAQCLNERTFMQCADGYFPTPVVGNQVICTKCPSGGLAVNCFNATFALTCVSGYFAYRGDCLHCPSGAATCSYYGQPTQCAPNFFLNTTTGNCQQCGANALQCLNNTVAQTCFAQYGVQNGECVKCRINTKTCQFNGNFTGSNSTSCFASFILNNSSANTTCECPTGQAVQNFVCVSTSTNNPTNQTVPATSCPDFYFNATKANATTSKRYLQSSTIPADCKACGSNCKTCNNATDCSACINNNFELKTGACTAKSTSGLKLKIDYIILMVVALIALFSLNKY